MSPLPQGIPPLDVYDKLMASERHARIARYSERFARRYSEDVARDPLELWSRRWEYSFAVEAVEAHLAGNESRRFRILDAGSGFTFFPYFLADRHPGVEVTCVDLDAELAGSFGRASADAAGRVAFRPGDLSAGLREDGDGAYDVVACVSVLEHVDDRASALRELRRLVRPGGLVVLTFDVAIDGDYNIPVAECERLLAVLSRLFKGNEIADAGQLRERVRDEVLTTRRIARREAFRMPWENRLYATLGSLRHGFLPRSYGYRNLTVWCGRVTAGDLPSI